MARKVKTQKRNIALAKNGVRHRILTDKNKAPNNPRTITEGQLKALSKSLEEFGDLSGVIFNLQTGHLVGGNQRTTAFAQDELKATITRRLKTPDKTGTVAFGYIAMHGTQYSYREVDWPKDKETAANIAANQHGGEFDNLQLSELLKSLGGKFGNDLLGFSDAELSKLMSDFSPATEEEQGKLDQTIIVEITCPKCGHRFKR